MTIDIEALKREHEKKLAEAMRVNEICAMLPLPPRYNPVIQASSAPWVSYEANSLQEAVNMLPLFHLTEYGVARNSSFTTISTLPDLDRRDEKEKWDHIFHVEGAPFFDCYSSSGSYGSRYTDMVFFAALPDGPVVRVAIRTPPRPIRVVNTPLNNAHNCASFRKEYPPVPGASSIAWGTGAGKVTHGAYWFDSLDTFWTSMATYDIVRPEGV